MPVTVTVTETIVIARPPETVWDFTQDYARRCVWDAGILRAEVEPGGPPPRVRIRARGGLVCTFEYKQFDRPHRTSLVMKDVRSPIFSGGGGSWSYSAVPAGTQWTQTNTLRFRHGLVGTLLAGATRVSLARATRRAMARAKERLEAEP